NAKEAKILQNFGDGICKILDEKLQRYYRENGADASIHALPKGAPPPGRSDNNIILAPSKKKNAAGDQGKDGGGDGGRKKKREYVPQKRSGGYAVLLTLYKETQVPGSKGYMFKMELQAEAQHLCDKSFTAVIFCLCLRITQLCASFRYSLTEGGLTLAERLASAEQTNTDGDREAVRSELEATEEDDAVVVLTGSDEDEEEKEENRIHPAERQPTVTEVSCDVDDVRSSGKPQDSQTTMTTSRKPNAECLLPGTYEIMLCVDFIETTGGSHHRKQELVKELQRNGVNFDIRKLNVGDFLWVAREKVAPVAGQLRAPVGRELVLDYIVERKRMDDLCGSIIDGRFREQKFRLKRCGLHKPIYLVEECGSAASHLSLPETTLQQAIVNTQVECTRGATWVTLKLKQMLWCPAGRSHQKMVRCGTCVASLPC
ncbi:crossover junction endonuclease MUS81-like, partial [Pundamilia nyererei]|uniref:Crossover junction endonuclease MUS81 n=1 Tax=Pundamilia nyererei TaxID=303518 RepID=A0A9Y3S689_9CICH